MKGPIDAARQQRKRRRYPHGKALARIQYFDTQRGIKPASQRRRGSAVKQYFKAHAVKAALTPEFADSVNLPVWRSLGPSFIPKGQTYGRGGNNKPPVSGRCSGIYISPANSRHLVLCSGGGGLWGTFDQGATWQPLTDRQPTLSMGAITGAPNSPNILYAGTGEGDNESQQGVGLLRSSDGGQTWTLVSSKELAGTGIYDIAVDPSDALHLWVGTLDNFLESKDGGAKWRTVRSGRCWDISINPVNPQEIFASTAGGLIRSTNGGAKWVSALLPGVTAETEFARMEVCHAPSNPSIVYVAAVHDNRPSLWRRNTVDGAFITEKSPKMSKDDDIQQAWYDFCFAVSPVDPDVVYWGLVFLYMGRRSAKGWAWQDISARKNGGDSIHGDQHHLAFDPSDPNVLYACCDGGIFQSPNAGTNWKSLNPGLTISEFEFIVHLESQDDWLIGGTQDNGTLGNPKKNTWDQIAVGDGGDCGADDDQKICYHSFYDMWLERAPALGPKAFNWTDASPPVTDDYDCLFYPPMDVRSALLAKAGVTLFVSEDTGKSWEEVDFGGKGKNASAVVIVSADTIFLGAEDGRLVRIQRAADGWSDAKVTKLMSPRKGFISDIVVPGEPDKLAWVSYSNFGGGHIFISLNGGKTWKDRSGNLPDIPVNAFVIDPQNPQALFAATDHGVYRTHDGGVKWTDFSNGLPNVVVGDMILHERLRLLRIGTRNRGAWELKI